MTDTRYPLEPLAQHLGINLGQIGGHQPGQHPTGITALADRLGISPRVAQRHRRHGLTPRLADRYACTTGTHPANIWPTWWTDIEPLDDLNGTARHNAAKTHCPRGHTYDHIDNRGYRICRRCQRRRVRNCRKNYKRPAQNTRYTQQCLPGTHNL